MELLAEELLVLRRHILKRDVDDAMLFGHHLRAQRMQYLGTECVVDADALLQGDDFVPVAHGLLLTTAHQGVDGCQRETGGVVALGVYRQMQVGDGEVLVEFVLTVHVHDLADDAHCATHVLGRLRRTLHRHADDDVGSHLTGEVCRIVVLQTTVHQHLVTQSHRREGSGDGHRGAHSLWQPSAVEVHLFVGDDVRRRTSKGDGQVVGEVERIGVAHAELVEELGQVLALDDAAGIHVLLADGYACRKEIGVLFLPVAEALVAQVLLVGDHVAPVLHPHHRVERVGVVADGIQAADDAAHRRASDNVDGDARLLQYLQHADMCHTLRAAATQYDADLLPGVTDCHAVILLHVSRAVTLLCVHRAAHHRSKQCQYYLLHCVSKFYTFHLYLIISETSSDTPAASCLSALSHTCQRMRHWGNSGRWLSLASSCR